MDLLEDQTRSIKVPRYFADLLQEAGHCQTKTLELYCERLLDPDYVAAFQSVTNFDNLRRRLEKKRQVEFLFHKKNDTWAPPAGLCHAQLYAPEPKDAVGL